MAEIAEHDGRLYKTDETGNADLAQPLLSDSQRILLGCVVMKGIDASSFFGAMVSSKLRENGSEQLTDTQLLDLSFLSREITGGFGTIPGSDQPPSVR